MELTSTIGIYSTRASLLRAAVLIVWEELPMANKTALECTDQLLRYITSSPEPFGNKTFVGLGDFRQVAPVIRSGGPSAIFSASIKSSYLWQHFICLQLTQPIRHSSDLEYSHWVDIIGEGNQLQPISVVSMYGFQQFTTYEEAILFLFPNDILSKPQEAIQRSYLSPYNMAVDEFNKKVVERLPEEECMSSLQIISELEY